MLIYFHYKALGTKRLASEELVHDWDNKRLNIGSVSMIYLFYDILDDNIVNNIQCQCFLLLLLILSLFFSLMQTVGHQQSYPGFEQVVGTSGNPVTGPYASYPPSVSSGMAPNLQVPMPLTQQTTTPTLLGKG